MKQTKKEWTKNNILQVAKTIIAETGYESFTVRELAKVTGFSYTNVYYYFKDLNTLLWELRIVMIEDMITELSTTPSGKEDPIEEIIESFKTYIQYYFNYPHIFRFFYFYPFVQPTGDTNYQKIEEKFNELWSTSFTRLIQEEVIQPNDIELVVKTIIYALHGMIMLSFSSNGSMGLKDVETEFIKTVHYIFRKNK